MNPSEVRLRYVGELEELLDPGDYDHPGAGRLVKLRIRRAADGTVELLADSPDPRLVDCLLGQVASDLGVDELEALLCG